jgi:hypothetical protein
VNRERRTANRERRTANGELPKSSPALRVWIHHRGLSFFGVLTKRNPWSEQDGALLEAISRGEFAINGLRNRDLQKLLYPGEHQEIQRRRQSAAITRKLALLRAHGLIRQVPGSHRYLLGPNGRRIITALSAARRADVDQLSRMAT